MSFQTYAVGYPVTFVIMLISSVITGTLAAKLKTHARLSAQSAFVHRFYLTQTGYFKKKKTIRIF